MIEKACAIFRCKSTNHRFHNFFFNLKEVAAGEDSEDEEQVVAEEAGAEVAVEIVDDGSFINFPHFIKKKLNFKLKNFIYLQSVCV